MSNLEKLDKAALIEMVEKLKSNQKDFVIEEERLRESMRKMQEEAANGDRRPNGSLIYKQMLAIKQDLGAIGKDQFNEGQRFKFRGIDQFINALKPLLDKHRVGILVNTLNYPAPHFVEKESGAGNNKKVAVSKNVGIIIQYTFFAEDGSEVKCSVPAEGVDNGDKGTNKALSAAFKYCLIQTFCVPTEDMEEGDRENPSVGGSSQRKSVVKEEPKKEAKRTYNRKAPEPEKEIPKEEAKEEQEKPTSNFLKFQEEQRKKGAEQVEASENEPGEEDY